MDATAHLTPDVLEVVREVAAQEDSFLLRAQKVDITKLVEQRTPLITSTAPFLSKVERHLLDCHREEVAYAWECLLYELVTALSDIRTAIPRPRAGMARAGSTEDGSAHHEATGVALVNHRAYTSHGNTLSREEAWRVASRFAMAMRLRPSSLINTALGHLSCNQPRHAGEILNRPDTRPLGGLATWHANRALAHSMVRQWVGATRSYVEAWRMAGDTLYLFSAALNASSVNDSYPLPVDAERALLELADDELRTPAMSAHSPHFSRTLAELRSNWYARGSSHPSLAIHRATSYVFNEAPAA